MSKNGIISGSLLTLCVSAALLAAIPAAAPVNRSQAKQTLIQLPLRFEANRGQTDASVKFIARGPGYTMLLADLATLAKNRVRFAGSNAATLTIYTQPTALQQHALDLLQVRL